MKSTLRTRIAAAALVLSPIAALVAQPALAQHPAAPSFPVAPVFVTGPTVDDRAHEGWRHGRRGDERAPVITALTPEPGDRTAGRYRTTVSARYFDRRSGVDPQTVRLRIDGRDVTGYARIEEDEIRFRDALAPGRHVAEVIVRDRAGNTARRAWEFEVGGHRRSGEGYGYGYGREDGRRWER